MVITLAVGITYGAHDIDFTYNLLGGEKEAGDKTLSEWVHELALRYYGSFHPTEKFAILLSEDFDGITGATDKFPARTINHPVNSRTSLGLEFTGLGRLQIKGFSQTFFNSFENDFPIYFESKSPLVDATMIQRSKNSADIYWEIPVNDMTFTAEVLYTNLIYDYYRLGDKKEGQYDSDLWFDGSFNYSLHEGKLQILCRGLAKYDFNEYGGYNLANIYLGIGSDFLLFKRKVKGTAEALPRYYVSSIMEHKGYADGLGAVSRIRLFYRMKPRLFLKGDVEYEFAPAVENNWYVKRRYELAIRKAWKNLSSVEVGGWGTFVVLFPRLCSYVAADISAIPKLDIIPGVRAYWLWDEEWSKSDNSDDVVVLSSGYSFVRTDLALLLRYALGAENSPFFKHFAFKGGAEYTIFNWEPVQDTPYVNNLRLFLGITNYL